MRRSSDWLPKKESELSDAFIPWIETSGWDVYQEVQFNYLGQVADLVLRRDSIIWVIEMKTSLSLSLLGQADNWRFYSNYVSIIIPNRKSIRRLNRSYRFVTSILNDRGIGLITIGRGFDDSFLINEDIRPKFQRHKVSDRWDFLHDGYKVSGKAGNSNGERWTAFRQTCWNLWDYLSTNPGATMGQIIKDINHHYSSTSTAKQCLFKWISSGVIKGIRVDESNRPYKFYLENDFNWRTEVKHVT